MSELSLNELVDLWTSLTFKVRLSEEELKLLDNVSKLILEEIK